MTAGDPADIVRPMNGITRAYRVLGLVAVSVTAASLLACSQAADKSGTGAARRVTLTLEMPDHGDRLGVAFAAHVAQRSGGSLRIRVSRRYTNAVPANELRLARALQAGRAEVGYLPARAWSAAGLPAFRALLAPFAVTTDEAAHALASGQIARDVLARLPHNVVGLALVPSESRRVLAVRPPVSPAVLDRMRVRIVDDPQSAAAFRALGASAVQGMRARRAITALRDHRIEGVESAPEYILTNGYWNYARYLSGYGLFPKFQSIVVNRATWDRLSAAQRQALRDAAEQTVRSARTGVAAQERSELRQLCAAGVRIAVPTAQQLKSLVDAAQRATARLAGNEDAAAVLDAIRGLPGAGPKPLATPLPSGCATFRASDRTTLRGASGTIPDGVYVTRVTAEQFHAHGAEADKDIAYTTRLRAGHWTQTQTPTYPDQCADIPSPAHPACSGAYQIHGDEVTFTWADSVPPPVPAPATLRWSYFKGVVRFTPVDVTDPGDRAVYSQPWRKVR